MTRTFYAKVRIFSKSKNIGHSQSSLKTFGFDEAEARENVTQMVFSWGDIESAEIVKVSTRPIYTERYVVLATCKYVNGAAKNIKFNTFAETPEDAEDFFRYVTSKWNNLAGVEIQTVQKHK